MGVSFRNWVHFVLQVVSKHHIAQSEVSSRPVWQVINNEAIRFALRLVNYDQVSELISLADFDEVLHYVVTTVHSLRIRNDQFELLLEAD
jgi:hypothetical protein